MADTVVLTVPAFSTLCNEAFKLRRAVFIVEQKVPSDEEFDAFDLTAHHVVAIADGEVCGTLRIIHAEEHVKIGRVAVGNTWRGHGVASAMMTYAMNEHRSVRENRFYLTAQSDKIALYERFGFVAFGDEFPDGGMPHLAMKNY
ncbi:putative GNAT family N-acyltransferase [Rhizobium tibeticum]|uniref:Predicted N-acyltransferase, GNAT family n=1 Tax=Rhizobium tibeticum TaxID=501024 RepID=A0A1H8LMH2_9HYPH|nr:GNAT family N-acetyltransferase [Rhizobium tibeticum]MDP9811892.1 putative GNAT family N-acyltransferase [Rhizobium tibeticum]SEH90392.1 putative N-acetyltransferase YjcF [Rhizobium tibeticum]SEO06354.1 Predicted N-acyltransferase, GNAT family [Rhizobium tibeticum]